MDLFSEIDCFTDFLGKSKFYCPIKIDQLLNEKLAYFTGCSLGDGHIDLEGKKGVLVDGSSFEEKMIGSEEFVENLGNLLNKWRVSSKIYIKPTKIILQVNNKLFCRFLNFFFGLPFGKKKNHILTTPPYLLYLTKI